MSAASEIARVRAIVEPIASDLGLDLYDIERRGATMRVTLDTLPGSAGGVTLDELSLATRLISRELDHEDPIAGHYTLEVTSPGLERALRSAAHFRREVGQTISVRLRDPLAEPRRLRGVLVGADAAAATLLGDDGVERTIPLDDIDKARTVFDYAPAPKPGKGPSKRSPAHASGSAGSTATSTTSTIAKEQHES
jgi:ribosome maturation factor RimP